MSEPNSGPPIEPPDSAVGILVVNEATAQDRVADNLLAAILTLWTAFSAYYAGASVVAFAQRMARLVILAQKRAGGITEAHLRQQFRRLGYELPTGTLVDLPDALRFGADEAEVYQRPIREIRYLVSTGIPLQEAVQSATDRIEEQISLDLQLARTAAAQQIIYNTAPKIVTGYRRVIHPEEGNVCGLCIAASDRIYPRAELLPIHAHCKCTVLPIVLGEDPGAKINYQDVTRIYAAAGSNGSAELKKVRVEFTPHGEMGRILTRSGLEIKGPREVKRQLSDRAAEMRRQQLQRQIAELKARERISQWHSDRIEQLQELLDAA